MQAIKSHGAWLQPTGMNVFFFWLNHFSGYFLHNHTSIASPLPCLHAGRPPCCSAGAPPWACRAAAYLRNHRKRRGSPRGLAAVAAAGGGRLRLGPAPGQSRDQSAAPPEAHAGVDGGVQCACGEWVFTSAQGGGFGPAPAGQSRDQGAAPSEAHTGVGEFSVCGEGRGYSPVPRGEDLDLRLAYHATKALLHLRRTQMMPGWGGGHLSLEMGFQCLT